MSKIINNIAPVGVLWFIHDDPGITEKVPYMCESEMLDAIKKFHNRYGAAHESEFMVIFTDPAKVSFNEKIGAIIGNADYSICNMHNQPYLF